MRYKLLIAARASLELLLLVQAPVFSAPTGVDRSQSAPIVSVAMTPV